MASGTSSSRKAELAAALHRLRSTLARLKAELELAEEEGSSPPPARLLEDVEEALAHLGVAETAVEESVKVLVADDDVKLAEITVRALVRRGLEAQAAAALRSPAADEVLVVDLGLLNRADEALLELLRAARPIVVTGGTDRASRLLAERVGATDYFVKPVDVDELARAIRRRAEASP